MDQGRVEFGSKLRKEREARSLSLDDVARVTKIPSRSLERLEAGSFEDLPADVFVRGFIRSYARCVGLDAEDALRHYGELITDRRAVGSSPPVAASEVARAPAALAAPSAAAAANPDSSAAPAPRRKRPTTDTELNAVSKAIVDAGRGTRRVSLTFAVIILVIVATLTLSLLLTRPSHIGDGVSQAGEPSNSAQSFVL